MKDDLGDRMKMYEQIGAASAVLMPRLPIIVRLDGKAFHSFTRGLRRPFDGRLHRLMDIVASELVHYTNARIGYTQSDEITLVLYAESHESQVFFDGKRDKLNSVLAAFATAVFNKYLPIALPKKQFYGPRQLPLFDCRCFTVPSKAEAVNALIWREQDAVRNSIQMLAQSKFSHKELHQKSTAEMQEMLFATHGINYNDLDAGIKRGRYFQRLARHVKYIEEQIAKLPADHPAKNDPNATFVRRAVERVPLPILTKIINREEVIFDGADPETLYALPI